MTEEKDAPAGLGILITECKGSITCVRSQGLVGSEHLEAKMRRVETEQEKIDLGPKF